MHCYIYIYIYRIYIYINRIYIYIYIFYLFINRIYIYSIYKVNANAGESCIVWRSMSWAGLLFLLFFHVNQINFAHKFNYLMSWFFFCYWRCDHTVWTEAYRSCIVHKFLNNFWVKIFLSSTREMHEASIFHAVTHFIDIWWSDFIIFSFIVVW